MNRLLSIAVLTAALLTPLANAAPSAADIKKLVDVTGISEQLGSLNDMLKSGMADGLSAKQGEKQMSAEEQAALVGTVDAVNLSQLITGHMESALKQQTSDKEYTALMKWYESDLGKKISAAEVEASSQAAMQDMMQKAAELMGNQSRLQTAERIDQLTNTSNAVVNMQMNMSKAMIEGMSALAQDEAIKQAMTQQFEQQMQAVRPQMEAQTKQMVLISFVYTYRNFSDADIKQYEEFLSSPAAQEFTKGSLSALNSGFTEASGIWAKELVKVAEKFKKS